jgi:hypothetical protein
MVVVYDEHLGFLLIPILVRVRGPRRIAHLLQISVGNGSKDRKGGGQAEGPIGVKRLMRRSLAIDPFFSARTSLHNKRLIVYNVNKKSRNKALQEMWGYQNKVSGMKV